MKKTAILFCALLGLPLLATAQVSVNISTPGVNIQIGHQDPRGYYWDGYDWRSPGWWKEHKGRHVGMQGARGYWNGQGWQPEAPPGHERHRPDAHNDRAPQRDAPHADKPHGNPHDGPQGSDEYRPKPPR